MPQLTAHQRYASLQSLGVTLWVARKRLPGALPSTQCAWPQPEQPLKGKDKLRAALPAKTEAPPPPPTPSPPPEVAAAPQPQPQAPPSQAPVASLQADVWLLANGWQLVMERPSPQALTQQQVQLVQNLLAAFYPGGLGILSQHFFQWPLPGVPVEQGDEQELNLSLRAFLTGAQFQHRLAGLLAFGQRSSQLLSQDAALKLPEVYTAPGLDELLVSPAAKQAFWQQAGETGLRARFASSPLLL